MISFYYKIAFYKLKDKKSVVLYFQQVANIYETYTAAIPNMNTKNRIMNMTVSTARIAPNMPHLLSPLGNLLDMSAKTKPKSGDSKTLKKKVHPNPIFL